MSHGYRVSPVWLAHSIGSSRDVQCCWATLRGARLSITYTFLRMRLTWRFLFARRYPRYGIDNPRPSPTGLRRPDAAGLGSLRGLASDDPCALIVAASSVAVGGRLSCKPNVCLAHKGGDLPREGARVSTANCPTAEILPGGRHNIP